MTDGSAELELVRIQGVWWRQSLAGADPLGWFEPPPDGRWQRGAVTGALYMSESPDTAWSEFFRAAAEQGLPPYLKMPRDLIRLEVDLDEIADLSTAAALGMVGLPWPEPVSRDWPAFQEVGEMLLAQGARGILAPSAAREGGINLCLFRSGPGPSEVTVAQVERFDDPPKPPDGSRTR